VIAILDLRAGRGDVVFPQRLAQLLGHVATAGKVVLGVKNQERGLLAADVLQRRRAIGSLLTGANYARHPIGLECVDAADGHHSPDGLERQVVRLEVARSRDQLPTALVTRLLCR
jgi:hypothetical protein